MDSFTLLERLSNLPGVSGFESPVREAIAELIEPFVDEMYTDALGNLIALRRGTSDFRLMLDAHMDEVGLMVQYIDERGFLSFSPIGGWDPRILPSHLVTLFTAEGRQIAGVLGADPPHILPPQDRARVIPLEKMFIDLGAQSRAEVEAMGVAVGDPVLIQYPFRRIGRETVAGKALDDRAGCATIIKALEALKDERLKATIVAAFVVAEERGLIGGRTAAYQIDPHMALVLEGTVAGDTPGVPPQRCPCRQGEGPAITVADQSFIAPREMVGAIQSIARREGIPCQIKAPAFGGTDAGAIHQSRSGVFTGVIAVPCRYTHSPFSTCRLSDFEHGWKLLAAFCKEAAKLDSTLNHSLPKH